VPTIPVFQISFDYISNLVIYVAMTWCHKRRVEAYTPDSVTDAAIGVKVGDEVLTVGVLIAAADALIDGR
jgi:hypothetical protein